MLKVDTDTCAITLTKGDSLRLTISVTRGGSEYVFASGDKLYFYARKQNETRGNPLISKEIDTATCELHLTSAETKRLDAGNYEYDIELQAANGDVDTIINLGSLNIVREVG